MIDTVAAPVAEPGTTPPSSPLQNAGEAGAGSASSHVKVDVNKDGEQQFVLSSKAFKVIKDEAREQGAARVTKAVVEKGFKDLDEALAFALKAKAAEEAPPPAAKPAEPKAEEPKAEEPKTSNAATRAALARAAELKAQLEQERKEKEAILAAHAKAQAEAEQARAQAQLQQKVAAAATTLGAHDLEVVETLVERHTRALSAEQAKTFDAEAFVAELQTKKPHLFKPTQVAAGAGARTTVPAAKTEGAGKSRTVYDMTPEEIAKFRRDNGLPA